MRRKSLTYSIVCLLAFAGLAVAQPTDDDLPFKEDGTTKIPLFMHSETFNSGNGSGWARDDVEIEAAMTMSCIPGNDLFNMLEGDGRRGFRRLRRSPAMEAFTSGFDADEIPWGGDSHRVREGRTPWNGDATPIPTYVWLTIESDRFSVDPERGERRLNMGTDVMDDIYYDTDDFLLLRNAMSVRARKRWDTLDTMRRLLIALKMEAGVDAFGIKRAGKTDVRRDSPSADAIHSLDEAVPRGIDSWSNSPAVPLRRAYETLKNRGALLSTPSYKDVLVLKPQAFIRSVRSRYHLNETSLSTLRSHFARGKERLEAIVAMAAEARMDGAIPSNQVATLEAFEQKVRDVLSGDLIAERAKDALAALAFDATDGASIADLMPGTSGPGGSNSLADLSERDAILQRRKVVAETTSDLYHELAKDLDDGSSESLRRLITRSMDRSLERHAEWIQAWEMSKDPNLRRIRTWDRFSELHAKAILEPENLAAYNLFGAEKKSGDHAVVEFINDTPELTAAILAEKGGISAARAELILAAKQNQPNRRFPSLKAVGEVSGIGDATIDDLKDELGDRDRDFRRFESIDQDAFEEARFQLRNEQVRIWIRQIEMAGSAAKGLWFDEAREFYVPSSSRASGNFLIDTMDFAAMYDADVWGDLPPEERTAAVDLSKPPYSDHLIHATVVNEVQIELLSGGEYTKRLKELKALTALPRFFMNWAASTGEAATPDEAKALFETMKALGDDELKTKLIGLNEYMRANESPISAVDESEFREWISPERLTAEVRDDPSYTEPEIDKALEGAQFVFGQYRDMLQHISKLKEDRVRDTLEDAGAPDCMEWVPTEGSKGSIALGILKRRADANGGGAGPGDNGGIIGGLGGDTGAAAGEAHTKDEATGVKVGDDHAGLAVASGKDDFYKVVLAPGATVTATIHFTHSEGDLDLAIVDENDAELARSDSTSNDETASHTNSSSAPLTVYVRVYGYDSAAAAYSLEIR